MAKAVARKKFKDSEDRKGVQTQIPAISDRATKRVIAPFVRIIRKDAKPVEAEEGKQFSFYLQKKPSVLIRDLSSFLSDSVDLPSLLHETADVLKNVTKATGVTLYMMDPANSEIYVGRKIPADNRHKIRWKIQEGTTVAAFVASKKEYVLVDDILTDDRFPEGIGYEGETIKSVMCVPVVTPDGECFAVIELYRQLFDGPFNKDDDLKITIIVTGWMGAAIHQNSQRLALKRQQELNDYLLDLTKCYLGEAVGAEKMISEIVKFAKMTLGAERGTFFVIDRDSEDLVADMFDEADEDDGTKDYKKSTKVRFGKERGITAVVARTGITINVKDAYNDTRFNKEIDQKTGFITRSILCMPIIGVTGPLGVLQVVNKKSGGCFTTTDELLFRTFCTYSSLALHFSKVNKEMGCTVKIAQLILSSFMQDLTFQKRLNSVFLKLIQLQIKPCVHDVETLSGISSSIKFPPNFQQFSWHINPSDHSKMPQYCVYMMLDLINKSEVHLQQLMQYILTVRKLYRKVPYHNFEHAFTTLHAMYLILKRNKSKFSPLEIKALLISALCHDVDHPGISSGVLCLKGDDLAYLYHDFNLRSHHNDVTEQILKGNNMFPLMTEEDRGILLEEVREAILMTDLFNFFYSLSALNKLIKHYEFDWNNSAHRTYLKSVMMTAADYSGQCKPFLVAKRITDNMYSMFFVSRDIAVFTHLLPAENYRQGDMIKAVGQCPLSLLDREKQKTHPEEQVRFLSVVVLPCVSMLRAILPNTANLCNDCSLLIQTWQDIIDVRGKKCWRQDDSIVEKSYS